MRRRWHPAQAVTSRLERVLEVMWGSNAHLPAVVRWHHTYATPTTARAMIPVTVTVAEAEELARVVEGALGMRSRRRRG